MSEQFDWESWAKKAQVWRDWVEHGDKDVNEIPSEPFVNTAKILELYESINQREADAFTAGRAEAKAEDAEIARHASVFGNGRDLRPSHDKGWFDACMHIADAILAPSSGPSYEQRLRAEIAEAVGKLPRYSDYEAIRTAILNGSEK